MLPDFFQYIIVQSTIINVIIAIALHSNFNVYEKRFSIYIYVICFFEVLAFVTRDINNLPGLHVFTLSQFCVTTLFFGKLFNVLKIAFDDIVVVAIGTLLILANSIFIQSVYKYNSYSKSLVEAYIVGACIVLFIQLIKNSKIDRATLQPSVTFLSALFIQAGAALIFYAFINEILDMQEDFYINALFDFKLIIDLIVYLSITYGLYQVFSRSKIKSREING